MFTVIYAIQIKAFVGVLNTAGELHWRTPFLEQLLAEHFS